MCKAPDFELPAGIDLAFIAHPRNLWRRRPGAAESWKSAAFAYTGEGVAESELAFDKIRSKEAFRAARCDDARTGKIVTAGQRPTIPIPFVIKAPRQGSTVGVHIVKNEREVDAAMADAAKYDQRTAGREIHVPAAN